MINGKIFFALAAQKLGSDKALPFLAMDPALGAGARTVMSLKLLEQAEAQVNATAAAEARANVAEATIARQKDDLTKVQTERDAATAGQTQMADAVTAANQLTEAAKSEAQAANDASAALRQASDDLQSQVRAKDAEIETLTRQLTATKGAVTRSTNKNAELRQTLDEVETAVAAAHRDLDALRVSHAQLRSEFALQDRAFTALAHQFAGPDATDAEKAALEDRMISAFASIPDDGPEALTELMLELMTDRRVDSQFAELEAKLEAHPALKDRFIATLRTFEQEHLDRITAFHDEVKAELEALDAPKKPGRPRKKKG